MAANTAVPDVPEWLQGGPRIIAIQVQTILPPRHNLEPEVLGDEPEPERMCSATPSNSVTVLDGPASQVTR